MRRRAAPNQPPSIICRFPSGLALHDDVTAALLIFHKKQHGIAVRDLCDLFFEIIRRFHRFAIHFHYYVSLPERGAVRGTSRLDVGDHNSVIGIDSKLSCHLRIQIRT